MENKLISNIYDLILLIILIIISVVNIYFIVKVIVLYVQRKDWLQIKKNLYSIICASDFMFYI